MFSRRMSSMIAFFSGRLFGLAGVLGVALEYLGHEGIGRIAIGVAGDVLADRDFHAFTDVFAADLGHRAIGGDNLDRNGPDEIPFDDPEAARVVAFLQRLGGLRRYGLARRLVIAASELRFLRRRRRGQLAILLGVLFGAGLPVVRIQ